jgi:hypothetical protein
MVKSFRSMGLSWSKKAIGLCGCPAACGYLVEIRGPITPGFLGWDDRQDAGSVSDGSHLYRLQGPLKTNG